MLDSDGLYETGAGWTGEVGKDIAYVPAITKSSDSRIRNRKLVWRGLDARIEMQKRGVEYALRAPRDKTRRT